MRDPRTVLCFGDSNTYGQSSEADRRLPYADRWVTHLQQILGPDFIVISEGLNGRTTVHDDPVDATFVGVGGGNLNGRRYILPCLHSHSPIDTVVLALGTNDMKTRFNLSAAEIRLGLRLLLNDIKQSASGPNGDAPTRIIVVSPPACQENPDNASWGFAGCNAKSCATIDAFRQEADEQRLPFVDLSSIATVGTDGIHFCASAAGPISKAIASHITEGHKRKERS